MINKIKKNNRGIIIAVEGNIGSGKSNLIKGIKTKIVEGGLFKEEDVITIDEVFPNTKEYYKGKEKAEKEKERPNVQNELLRIEKVLLLGRKKNMLDSLKNKEEGKCVIIDHSILFSPKFFYSQAFLGTIKKDMLKEIESLWKECLREIVKSSGEMVIVDILVDVETKPYDCFKNIRHRGREGEEKISMDYLSGIDSGHKMYKEDLFERYPQMIKSVVKHKSNKKDKRITIWEIVHKIEKDSYF